MFTIQIKESDDKIAKLILKEIMEQVNVLFKKVTPNIEKRVKLLFHKAIENCPEMEALRNPGDLGGQLGVIGPEYKQQAIFTKWIDSIHIIPRKISISNNQVQGGFIVCGIADDFGGVLNMEEARQVTEKGTDLLWLQWLLIYGDATIIADYDVAMGDKYVAHSRTGGMVMVKNSGRKRWGIPSQYAGTINNNFLTRTINLIDNDIVDIIQKELS